jgi:hypothetical protein
MPMMSAPQPLGRSGRESARRSLPSPLGDGGWIGTRELPGYRAGGIVAKLADLPVVAPGHLYFDLLLLDAQGRTAETLSGACLAMPREQALDERSRFVRVAAELLRHAPDPVRGLAGLSSAVDFIREHGLAGARLGAAARHLDAVCSERSLVAALCHLLASTVGVDEARQALRSLLARIASRDLLDDENAWRARDGELAEQVLCVVRRVGRGNARRVLGEATDFELLPDPELLGV